MTTPSPKWPRNTLLILQGLQILSLAPWLMVGALSFMAFDAPGSENNKGIWTFVIAVWLYPLWLLLAGIASWWLLVTRHRVAAVVLGSIFSIPALLLVLWIVVISVVAKWG